MGRTDGKQALEEPGGQIGHCHIVSEKETSDLWGKITCEGSTEGARIGRRRVVVPVVVMMEKDDDEGSWGSGGGSSVRITCGTGVEVWEMRM